MTRGRIPIIKNYKSTDLVHLKVDPYGGAPSSQATPVSNFFGRSRPTITVAANDTTDADIRSDYQCDGTADDVEIQEAIDALPATGGSVVLLEGNFVIDNVVDLVSYCTIRGMGNSTIVTAADGIGEQNILRANAITDIAIRDLQINGNITGNPRAGDPDNQNGIEIRGSDRFRVENTYIHDTPDNGIGVMHGCTDGFITGNHITSPGWHCIMLWDDVHNVVVNGNYVQSAINNVGIAAEKTAGLVPSTYNVISNNIVEACRRGIVDIDSNFVTISNNIIYDGTLRSIEIVTSEQDVIGVNIVGNVIYNQTTEHPIQCVTPTGFLIQDCIIADNIIHDCFAYAIFIGKLYRVSICNNIMTDNDGGIRFSDAGADSVLIVGNISDNTNWDIFDLQGSNHYITDNLFMSPNKINGVVASATIKDNLGYVTENGGTSAAIATGATIAHGLDATPTIVQVNAAEAGPTDITIAVGAANITVNFGGGGNKTFFWYARYSP